MSVSLRQILNKSGKFFRRMFFILLWVLFGLIVLVFSLILLIRTPWAQNKIVSFATSYVSGKTHTVVHIDKLFITFSGGIQLDGLYAEDLKKDTLVYSHSLHAEVAFLPLLDKKLKLKEVEWDGVTAHIVRSMPDSTFNFDFFIKAFAGDSPEETVPDTTISDPFTFDLGYIHLSNIRGNYTDEVLKLDTRLVLGDLVLDAREFDLQKLSFGVKKLALKNTTAYVRKDPTGVVSTDTTTSTLPQFWVDNLLLDNVHALYESPVDSLSAEGRIAHFSLSDGKLNLDKETISLGNTLLANSVVKLHLPEGTEAPVQTEEEIQQKGFQWPGWQITAKDLQLQHDDFSMHIGNRKATDKAFDAQHIELKNLNLHASDTYLKPKAAGMTLTGLSLRDRSGFEVKKLGFELAVDKKQIALNNLVAVTSNSSLSGAISMTFEDLYRFFDKPENGYADLQVRHSSLSLEDAYFFAPDLRKDTMLQKIGMYPVSMTTQVKGYLGDLDLRQLDVRWAKGTQLNMHGEIKGLPDTDKLYFDIPAIDVRSVKQDWLIFLKEDSSFVMPAEAHLQANAKGSLKDLSADAILQIPEGKMDITANYRKKELPEFNGLLTLTEMNVGKLVPTSQTGLVSMEMDFEGKGDKLQNLDATIETTFRKLQLRGYNYAGMNLRGRLLNQVADVYIQQKDTNLNVFAQIHAVLDTLNPAYQINLNLEGADFQALGFTSQNIKARTRLTADFIGTPADFTSHLNVKDGLVLKDEESYPIGTVAASFEVDSAYTKVFVDSDIIKAKASANTDPQKLNEVIMKHINTYFESTSKRLHDTILQEGVVADAHILVHNTRLLNEVILPDLKQMDSVSLKVMFRQNEKLLSVSGAAPQLSYADYELNNFALKLETNPDTLDFSLSYDSLKVGPARIYQTSLAGQFNNDSLNLQIDIHDRQQDSLLYLAINSVFQGDSAMVHLDNVRIVFNKEYWQMPDHNRVTLTKNTIGFREFELKNKQQTLALTSNSKELDRFKVELHQFRLGTITSFINAEKVPADGIFNGYVDLQKVFTKLGFEADIKLDSFSILSKDLGRMTLKSNNLQNDVYQVDMAVGGGAADLGLKGSYQAAETEGNLDLNLDIRKIDMAFIEAFVDSLLDDSKGSINGKFTASGNPKSPKYKGSLGFNKAYFKVRSINSGFSISDDGMRVDNDGIYFSRFSLKDEHGNAATLSGTVGTKVMTNPTFDLRLVSNDFQLINSTRKDNDLYYGKVLMDVNLKVTGDLSEPHVDVKTRLNKGTAVTLIVPESKVEVVDREGVVIFTNTKNPDDPMTNERKNLNQSVITGMQVRALIQVDPTTSFTIVMDERAGDFLEVKGEANLTLDIDPNGRMAMSGQYELKGGQYNVSLYGVVKRNFQITPGGTITWNGTAPMNAEMNLSASYFVKASSYDLMAQQISGTDVATQTRYRQVLPFNVFINIKGRILSPVISFAIDMPEKDRGALGGNVYARVQQLNQDQNELNTQVFALLVLNRFIPSGSGSGGSTSSGAVAKSSVSQILSGQLNSLSEKYVKFVDLNVDLNSYTDYQTGVAQDRTDLSISAQKKLFNDRVVVKVGSQTAVGGQQAQNPNGNNSAVLGDASLEYLLTADGKYLLTGFRKNEYEGVVDGQLIVTGVSIVLNKEFNQFREIWRADPEKKRYELEEKKREAEQKKEDEEKKEENIEKDKNDSPVEKETGNKEK